MAFQTGNKLAGSRKGRPNKATKETREAFKALIEANVGKMDGWLQKAAKKNPAAALALIVDMAEFVLPKLQRTELTGANGETLKVTLVKGL